MAYEVPYQLIDDRVWDVIKSRTGLGTTKVAYTARRIHQGMIGIIMTWFGSTKSLRRKSRNILT